jgi:conjugal transfer pilus assembly protein TraF
MKGLKMQLKKYINKIFFISLLIISNNSFAEYSSYCQDNNLGWHFYCDKEEQKEENKFENQNSQNTSTLSYSQRLKNLQEQIEEAKAKAVLEPTEQNIKDYIVFQAAFLNQSSAFADTWQRTLWKTPELDYTQYRPVNNVAKKISDNEKTLAQKNVIKEINKRYGIFFIYSSTCPYCIKYGEILNDFRNEYKINIIGISIDGQFLPNWEKTSRIEHGELAKMGVQLKKIPVTLLYDNQTKTVIPVVYGLVSQSELITRIYLLTQVKAGENL